MSIAEEPHSTQTLPLPPVTSGAADDAPVAEPGITLIRRRPGWQLVNVAELWHYRELLFFLTWRDVKIRYKQSALGVAWACQRRVA